MPAITRDSSCFGVRLWISANSGTTKKPANRPIRVRSIDDAPAARLRRGSRRRRGRVAGADAAAREVQVDAERGHAERAERHQADLDRARRQLLAQQRARRRCRSRTAPARRCTASSVAAQVDLGVGRQLRGQHRADEPEPRHAEDRVAHRRLLARQAQHRQRFGHRVPVDLQVRRAGFDARDRAADQVAGDRQQRRPRWPRPPGRARRRA